MEDLAKKIAIMVVLSVVLLSFVGWKIGFILSPILHISKGWGGIVGLISGGVLGFFLIGIISRLRKK